jgi:phosphoglycerate dehydrogenase-like enzyme
LKICVTRDLADQMGASLLKVAPDAEVVTLDFEGIFDGDPDGAEILVFSTAAGVEREVLRALVPQFGSPDLRWLQAPGAGVDHPAFKVMLERGIRLTNAAGIHAEPIAQYIFAYVLHWERQIARHQAQQAAREWKRIVSDDLTSKTLGIVGLGGIGEAAARVARAFGMRVVATRRTPVESADIDRFYSPKELHALLAESHYVVLSVPLTDATRHMIATPELEAMRDDAILINVARGPVVDEPALIEALRAGTIRGATLDVTSSEPLPEESPLWTLPNCVVTPHDAGWSPRATERIATLFLDNLGRYLRGESMRNEITTTGL